MNAKMEKFPAKNPNPVLSVAKDGTVFYSNEAGKPLLHEWDLGVGDKLPSSIREIVQRAISRNSPEKMEVKAENRVYLVEFHPLPDEECVNIYGFDISYQKELEEKLQESERRYHLLFENVLDGFAYCKMLYDDYGHPVDFIYLDTNSAFERLTGLKDMNGKRATEITPWIRKLYPELFEIYGWVALTGQPERFEIEFKPLGIWLSISVYSTEREHIVTILDNITVRKKAEGALKKAHDRLENRVKRRTSELEEAYESLKEGEKGLAEAQKMAHIGNWDWDIATDKAYWSDELYRIFGRNPQELAPSYNEYLSYIHPDDRENADKIHKEALNGKPFSMDHRIILSNGEERTVHIQTEVIFDDRNIPIRLKGIVQDITERKRAEERIQNLANVVESSNDAIGTISLDGIFKSWNKGAEQVYGYSAEEIIGKSRSILTPSNLPEETRKLIEMVKQGKKVHNYETLRLNKDGKMLDVSLNLSPVFDAYGKLTAVSVIARDITERKKAEEALRNFEIASKKEIHHRIKNNLQVIYSLLYLQTGKFKGRKNIRDSEVLNAFRESMDRVFSIALIHEELYKGKNTNILNFSQYIEKLANNLLLTYRLKTDVSLNFDLEENLFLGMDTAIPLGIIVNELVSNSFKHAFSGRDKGEIQIKLHREENEEYEIEDCKSTTFTLSISDNGIGIPKDIEIEDLDSLGLQLVTTLVDQLDSELELKRSNGTEFTIRFEVTEEDIQALEESQPQLFDNE